ncbi:MAG: general secretion pathway protein D [Motiliproteus sp.]|jgi:general secretion pathway protein D
MISTNLLYVSSTPATKTASDTSLLCMAGVFMRFMKQTCVLLSFVLVLGLSSPALAEDFNIDMRDTDIKEFIATIGKLTNKTIIIDDRVKGKINIRSPRALSETELYDIFLVQLGVSGFTVVDLGNNILKVIPAQGAKLEGIEVQADDDALPSSSEKVVTRVVRVSNVDVNALVPILRPLVDNKIGIIAPYPASNVILITDRESNVRRLLQIIIQVDKADSVDTEIIKLHNASAQEMGQTLTRLMNEQPKAPASSKQMPMITADERSNSLLIRGDKSSRAYLKKVINKLDSEITTDTNTRVRYLKYAKATDLVPVLESIGSSITSTDSGAEGKGPLQNQASINIKAHEPTNSIVLSGTPSLIKQLDSVIYKLDIRRAQVHVEAIIVEMSETRAKELGVQWLFGSKEGSSITPVAGTNFSTAGPGINSLGAAALSGSADLATLMSGVEGLSLGLGRFKNAGFNFAALINALQSDTDSNILSTPSLMTMDNVEASILVGQEVPVITGATAGDNNSNPFQTISRQEVGIKLKITPQVNDGSAVQLKIEQEVSSISGTVLADIVTNKREIKTTVLIDDGATIVLGGLIDDDVQESSSKVPLLGDIPYLGRLFRSDSTKVVRRNLMVFIRPTIIRDQSAMAAISTSKYGYIRAQQLLQENQGIKLFPEDASRVLPEWTGMNPARSNLVAPE